MLPADDRFLWRSWGVRDGLTETYSYALSRAPGGNAYVRHGAVLSMSLFDGYAVTRIPGPSRQRATRLAVHQEGIRRGRRRLVDHILIRA